MLHTLLVALVVVILPASLADVLSKAPAILKTDTSTGYALVDPTAPQQQSGSIAAQLEASALRVPSGSLPTDEIRGHIELEGTGYCTPYSATSASTVPCGFTICGGASIIATTCPSYGGTYSGDTVLRILHNNVQVSSNDDYGGYQCSYVTSTISATSPATCTAVSISQTCYNTNVCSGTTYYTITLNAGSYVVNPTPSTAPTRSPTISPTTTANSLVGSFAVNSGPAWATVPLAYTCQRACAVKFGGSASDYQGSTSPYYVTATCTYDRYSGSTAVLADSYSNCATYLYGCYSAYVSDHMVTTLNYCHNSSAVSRSPSTAPTFSPTSRAPTLAPTRVPTFSPTSRAPTFSPTSRAPTPVPSRVPTFSPSSRAPSLGLFNVGSFAVADGPSISPNLTAYNCIQVCALLFGGEADDYQASTVWYTVTRTCFYDRLSGGSTLLSDRYSTCANYNSNCYSAYVSDHQVTWKNYCFLNTYSARPSALPTIGPTLAPITRTPTTSFPTRAPGSVQAVVGSFRVNSGPVWTTYPATYTCQQACAYLFGGSASDYIGSISGSYASATCYSDRYGGSSGIISDSYSNCATYYTTGCYSTYVSDNGVSSTNYCWSNNGVASFPSRLPTALPTRSPTRIPTRTPTTSNYSPGTLIGSFVVSSGTFWSNNPPAYSCQAACAVIYGGSAGDYSGSISAYGITNTCYYDRYYISQGTVGYLLSDSYSTALCVYYTSGSATDGCYSAYVADHSVSSRNYCYASNGVRSPSQRPTTRPPTPRPTTRPPTQIPNRTPTARPTATPSISLASASFCSPYTSPGTQEVFCVFSACGSFSIAASTCPQFGGSFTGDTYLTLYNSNLTALLSRDDYGGSRCSYIESTYVVGTAGVCSVYYIGQRCYGTSACTGTTVYFLDGPSRSPTASPTLTVETVYASEVRSAQSVPEIRPQSLWVRNASLMAIGDTRGYVWNMTRVNNPVAIATPAVGTEAVYGITGDNQGNVYFTQYSQCLIKQISAVNGSIRVVAGVSNNCTQMVSASKAASQSTLSRPWAIQSRVLPSGALQLCFSEHRGNMLRCFDATHDGSIQVKAGMVGASGYNSDNIAAVSAKLSAFTSFYIDGNTGDFYIADTGNSRIRRVSGTTGLISTVGSATQYSYPYSIAGDGSGHLYNSFADGSNIFSIRQTSNPASPSLLSVQTYAGTGVEGNGPYNGPALQMGLDGNVLLFADPISRSGVLYLVQPDVRNVVKLYTQSTTYSNGNFPPTQTPTAAPTTQDTTLQMAVSLSFSGFTSSLLSASEQQVLASTVATLLGINSQYVTIQSISVASATRRLRSENEKASAEVVAVEEERVPGTAELTPEAAAELAAATKQQLPLQQEQPQQVSKSSSDVSVSSHKGSALQQLAPQLGHRVQLQTYSLDIVTAIEVPLTDSLVGYQSDPSALANSFSSTLQSSITTGSFDSTLQSVATTNGLNAGSSSLFSAAATTMTVTSVTILTNAPTSAPTSSPGNDDDATTMPAWGWAVFAIILLAILSCLGGTIYLCCYRCCNTSVNNNPAANDVPAIQSVPATIELRTYQPNVPSAPMATSVSVVQPHSDSNFQRKQQAANDAALGNQPSFVVYPAVPHQNHHQQHPQAHAAPPLPPVMVTAVVVQPTGPVYGGESGPVPTAPPTQVQFLSLGPCDNADGFMNV